MCTGVWQAFARAQLLRFGLRCAAALCHAAVCVSCRELAGGVCAYLFVQNFHQTVFVLAAAHQSVSLCADPLAQRDRVLTEIFRDRRSCVSVVCL